MTEIQKFIDEEVKFCHENQEYHSNCSITVTREINPDGLSINYFLPDRLMQVAYEVSENFYYVQIWQLDEQRQPIEAPCYISLKLNKDNLFFTIAYSFDVDWDLLRDKTIAANSH